MSQLFIRVIHHDGTEEVRELPDGLLGIGRAGENWLCPLDTALSRQHSMLRVDAGSVWIEGLPSRNGTIVNGRRIEEERLLAPGDEITMGKTRIRLCAADDSAQRRRDQPTVDLASRTGRDESTIVAASQAMTTLLRTSERFASSGAPVLISGESGTGKELFARRIHACSARCDGPFVILNCPALDSGVMVSELFGVEAGVATGVARRKGRLEEADGGTLFLDEIGDLSPEAQAMLLRFLQDGTIERVGGRRVIAVDVRVVAASNRCLEEAIASHSFRSDLYFRIATLRLEIPPLRQRVDDVAPLVDWFLRRGGHHHLRLSEEAWEALLVYPFPGNVRELAAIVERASLLAEGAEVKVGELGLGQVEPGQAAMGPGARTARGLLESVVAGEADFWEAVYRPYQDREIPRAVVMELVAIGLERSGGSVKSLAGLLGVADRYRKLLDFLRNGRLMPS